MRYVLPPTYDWWEGLPFGGYGMDYALWHQQITGEALTTDEMLARLFRYQGPTPMRGGE